MAQVQHESSDFLLNLCDATFPIVCPSEGFRVEGHIVSGCHRVEHANDKLKAAVGEHVAAKATSRCCRGTLLITTTSCHHILVSPHLLIAAALCQLLQQPNPRLHDHRQHHQVPQTGDITLDVKSLGWVYNRPRGFAQVH